MVHIIRMWYAVCSGVLHIQFGEGMNTHEQMKSPNTSLQVIKLNPSCLGQAQSNRPGTGHGNKNVGSVVKWLEHCAYDQHGLGSKPTYTILLCPWERHFMALFPALWSWQAVLNFNHIFIKLQVDSNILVSLEAGRDNCLPCVLTSSLLSCELGGQIQRLKKKKTWSLDVFSQYSMSICNSSTEKHRCLV